MMVNGYISGFEIGMERKGFRDDKTSFAYIED